MLFEGHYMSSVNCHLRRGTDGRAGKNGRKMFLVFFVFLVFFLHLCNIGQPKGISGDIVGIS